MSSALDVFRAQREAADAVHARLTGVATLLRCIREETHAFANNEAFRKLLQEEQTWYGAHLRRYGVTASGRSTDSGRPSGDDGRSRRHSSF